MDTQMEIGQAFVSASILLLASFVNAAKPDKSRSFKAFFADEARLGSNAQIDGGRARFLDLEPGIAVRLKEVGSEDCLDGLDHAFEVVLSSGKVRNVLLNVGRDVSPEANEGYVFKLDPTGKVDRVVSIRMGLKDGAIVRGSGRSEVSDIGAPGVREKLQHELDFWLKGMYRKAPSQSPASKTP